MPGNFSRLSSLMQRVNSIQTNMVTPGQVQAAAASAVKVIEVEALTDTAGIATFTWPVFNTILAVTVKGAWVGNQVTTGYEVPGSRTATGVKIQAIQSKATLLLSTGPFEVAPVGKTVKLVVIGT